MGKKTKKASFWMKRRSHIPTIIIGTGIIMLLYFNEETSWSRSVEYDRRIAELKEQIKQERDSLEFYRSRRAAIVSGQADLEHMAREQFHMQRPSEDVFLLTDLVANEAASSSTDNHEKEQ
ncbi:MAG: hypothetical protein NC097_01315 [Clostridium sp.]|nr:hypothetical protein [Prevotella sp.]MCM1428420.1 hypothetical protein [Clostridium sp.]MCM1474885.1 hypothetical protein [Muribaculaceae bacterium]